MNDNIFSSALSKITNVVMRDLLIFISFMDVLLCEIVHLILSAKHLFSNDEEICGRNYRQCDTTVLNDSLV